MEMPTMNDDQTLAVLVSQVTDLRKDFASFAERIERRDALYMTRGEHEAWRIGIEREVKSLKDDAASSRAPWWSVLSAVAGAVAVAITIIVFIAK